MEPMGLVECILLGIICVALCLNTLVGIIVITIAKKIDDKNKKGE